MSIFTKYLKPGSGFFFKVLFSLLLLNGITISGLIYISYTFSEESLTSQAQDRFIQELDQLVADFIREYRDQVSRTLLQIENSSLMDEYLRGSSADKLVNSRRMERRLIQVQQDYPYYQDIQFFHSDGSVGFGVFRGKRNFTIGKINLVATESATPSDKLFKQLKDIPLLLSSGNMEWFMPVREIVLSGPVLDKNGNYNLLAGVAKMDKDTGEFGGAFIVKLSLNHLFNQLGSILVNGHNPVWLLNTEGNILFKPETDANQYLLDPRPSLDANLHSVTRIIKNESGLIAYRDIALGYGGHRVRMIFSVPKELLVQDLERAANFFTLVAMLSVAVSILISFLLSRFLSRPFKELTLARNQLTTAHRLARLGHWEWNEKEAKVYLSDNALAIFGRDGSLNTVNLDDFIKYVSIEDREMVGVKIRDAISQQKATKLDHYMVTDKGAKRYVHQEIDVIHDTPLKVVGTIQDLTERRRADLRIRELAYHDAVTGLANRTLLNKLAETALIKAASQHKMLAILFLDLDHFKRINDTLGHQAGDELLRQVSWQLQTCLRPTDAIGSGGSLASEDKNAVARLGGDEFIIMLTDLDTQQDAIQVAERILNSLNKPFEILSSTVKTSGSLGISFFPTHGNDINELLRHADSAMYQAKSNGRSQFAIYNQQLDKNLLKQQKMENDLQNALNNKEFFLEYQPRINLKNNKLVSFEALIRWLHPQQGLIRPDEFIKLAENTGIIVPIGQWVIQTACTQLAEWQQKYRQDLSISINLSPVQFNSSSIVQEISKMLEVSGVLPTSVEFEVTEQTLFYDAARAIKVANEIKNLGFSLSIDDFGTGYSSLQQLRQLPVNILKIDQSFVREMLIDPDDEAIVRASIELGHSLGLKVVAEGVEEEGQVSRLKELGCDELQGYYFGRPQTADLCNKLLERDLESA